MQQTVNQRRLCLDEGRDAAEIRAPCYREVIRERGKGTRNALCGCIQMSRSKSESQVKSQGRLSIPYKARSNARGKPGVEILKNQTRIKRKRDS